METVKDRIMAEEPVQIPVDRGRISIEGLFEQGRIGRNAIICHPHPLYGGDMHNNVVQAARQTFADLGWATLRFNFRGAGTSGGHPAQGKEDASDLIAVSEFLRARSPGRIDLRILLLRSMGDDGSNPDGPFPGFAHPYLATAGFYFF